MKYVVVGPRGVPLTIPLSLITAEHCVAEWNALIRGDAYHVQPALDSHERLS